MNDEEGLYSFESGAEGEGASGYRNFDDDDLAGASGNPDTGQQYHYGPHDDTQLTLEESLSAEVVNFALSYEPPPTDFGWEAIQARLKAMWSARETVDCMRECMRRHPKQEGSKSQLGTRRPLVLPWVFVDGARGTMSPLGYGPFTRLAPHGSSEMDQNLTGASTSGKGIQTGEGYDRWFVASDAIDLVRARLSAKMSHFVKRYRDRESSTLPGMWPARHVPRWALRGLLLATEIARLNLSPETDWRSTMASDEFVTLVDTGAEQILDAVVASESTPLQHAKFRRNYRG